MRRLGCLAAVALISALGPAVPAEAATHLVTLQGGRFNEPTIEIAVGDTVQWTAAETGHTVTASDYRFDFWPNRTLSRAETVSWTFHEDETFRYICRVHAPGMSGVIIVGEGSPPPPPPPPITGESRKVPSAYPTIDSALAGIPPDSEVVLEPGVYPPFEVTVDDVLVRAASPDEVAEPGPAVVDGAIVDGGNVAKTGIVIAADHVRLRDLVVRRVADRAIDVRGDDATLAFLTLDSGFFEGVRAQGVARLRIDETSIAASPAAIGIAVRDPDALLVEDTTVAGASTGIEVREGNGVVVRRSTVTASGTGIALRGAPGAPLVGADVAGNRIAQTNAPVTPPTAGRDLVTGAGIWADHTWSASVRDNEIMRVLTYGIAITGTAGPTVHARSTGNVVSEARIAAEGWDGLGTACTTTAGTTEPPTLATTNRCGNPSPGLPFPKVAADLVVHAAVGTALDDPV